jgi:hypothetical protein
MEHIQTRILQDILRAEQIRLDYISHPLQRRITMQRISNIATELLRRMRNES